MEDQQKDLSSPEASYSAPSYQPTQLAHPSTSMYPSTNPYSSAPPPPPYDSEHQAYYPRLLRHPRNSRLMAIAASVIAAVLVLAIVLVVVSRNSGSINGQRGGQNGPTATGTSGSTGANQPTNQSPNGDGQPTQPSNVATPTTSPTGGTHHVGDVVVIDGWQVTVLGVKTSSGGEFDTPKPGNTFLEIDLSVVNQTGQSQIFAAFEACTLKDGTGQTYEQAFVSDAPAPPDGSVAANGKLRGTLVYEVPANMSSFEFDVTPNAFRNGDIAIWNLSMPK